MLDATTPAAVLCVLVQLPEAGHSGVANRSCLWGVPYGYLRTESYYHVVLGVLDILALFMILSPRNPLLSTYFKAHFLTKPLPKLNFLLLQLA